MGKQLVNIPVVLKAPGKEAGHARCSHSRAAWPSTATAQPRMQPPRGQTRAWPTSPLLSPWSLAGCHHQAAEIPLNRVPNAPSAKQVPAFSQHGLCSSKAKGPRGNRPVDPGDLAPGLPPLLPPAVSPPPAPSPGPLPDPTCAVFHTHTQPCRLPACFLVTGTVTPHLLHDACPRRGAQSATSAGGHVRVSGSGGGHGQDTRSLLGAPQNRPLPNVGPARPSPASELDGLVKPLLVHGLLHLLGLKANKKHRLETGVWHTQLRGVWPRPAGQPSLLAIGRSKGKGTPSGLLDPPLPGRGTWASLLLGAKGEAVLAPRLTPPMTSLPQSEAP